MVSSNPQSGGDIANSVHSTQLLSLFLEILQGGGLLGLELHEQIFIHFLLLE
jgi:hypothetical protein